MVARHTLVSASPKCIEILFIKTTDHRGDIFAVVPGARTVVLPALLLSFAGGITNRCRQRFRAGRVINHH
jgi:hypothetical protein